MRSQKRQITRDGVHCILFGGPDRQHGHRAGRDLSVPSVVHQGGRHSRCRRHGVQGAKVFSIVAFDANLALSAREPCLQNGLVRIVHAKQGIDACMARLSRDLAFSHLQTMVDHEHKLRGAGWPWAWRLGGGQPVQPATKPHMTRFEPSPITLPPPDR